jgi:hypothetical protein
MRVGTIAQLVEQRTFNPFVVGSTPAGPTNKFKHSRLGSFRYRAFFVSVNVYAIEVLPDR